MTLYTAHPSPWFSILVPTGLGVMLKSTYIIASVPATLNLSLVTFLVLALLGEFCFVPSQLGFAKIKLTKNAFCFYFMSLLWEIIQLCLFFNLLSCPNWDMTILTLWDFSVLLNCFSHLSYFDYRNIKGQ